MTAATKQVKERACKNPGCKVKFVPAMGQKVCSWACKQAIEPVTAKVAKAPKAPKAAAPRKPMATRKPLAARKPMVRSKPMATRKPIAQRERREIKVQANKVKSRSDYMAETQVLFNQFIRLRDTGLPCISCGKNDAQVDAAMAGWDCGHYRTVGACPELRFEPLNCARQCTTCNRDMSGNVAEYRPRLVQRIGADKVEWLEGPHEPRKYTIDDLKAIKAQCRERIKALKGSVG